MTTNKQIVDHLQNAKDLADHLKQVVCSEQPGYEITISIKKADDEQQTDYKLYDNAALLNELIPAIDYLIEDLS